MKIYKIILIVSVCMSLVACTPQKPVSEKPPNQRTTISKVPEYEYPDEFFNSITSQDDNGNIYFQAGLNFYQVDKQNNVKELFYCLIDNKYLVYDAKYYNGKVYLLVLKINQKNINGAIGLATVDLQGNNFEYLSDLSYGEKYLPADIVNFRIFNNKIYILDLYTENNPKAYIYSLETNTIEDTQDVGINEERFNFYKDIFPEYLYKGITHVIGNDFYQINNEKVLTRYNAIDKTTVEYNLSEHFAPNTPVIYRMDFLDNHWILFSYSGVFKFDTDFKNKQVLVGSNAYSEYFEITSKDGMVVLNKKTR